MNTPQKDSFLDRVFNTPPWKSRSFLYFAGAFILLLIVFQFIAPLVGPDEERLYDFGYLMGKVAGCLLFWFVLPYLLFLLLERFINKAGLSQSQTRLTIALAVFICALFVVLLIALLPARL